mmetsp:Transcript_35360/g.88407  ORF Transcript_35360/g.88407 Transcript_35360/m.88407 type:complete len:110 (-) Transcript_35360:179-508(-)
MQQTKEATPTTKEERAALTVTIRMREKELSEEKKRVDLLREEYSYEVRIAMQDQHQLRGGGASTSQDARLVSHHRNPIGGFFIGMDGVTSPQNVSPGKMKEFNSAIGSL